MTFDRTPGDDEVAEPAVPTPHRYVVIEGPIGVGKTSLVRRLGRSFGSELVLKQDSENPFLERFYRNPRAAAFQTQLYFLFQRSRQLQDLRQSDLFENVRVADYMLEKDRLFARLTLDDEEFALYEQVYEAPLPRATHRRLRTVLPRVRCRPGADRERRGDRSDRQRGGLPGPAGRNRPAPQGTPLLQPAQELAVDPGIIRR